MQSKQTDWRWNQRRAANRVQKSQEQLQKISADSLTNYQRYARIERKHTLTEREKPQKIQRENKREREWWERAAVRFSGKGKTNKRRKSMERVKIDFEVQVKRVKKKAKAWRQEKKEKRNEETKVDFEANAKSIKGKEKDEKEKRRKERTASLKQTWNR